MELLTEFALSHVSLTMDMELLTEFALSHVLLTIDMELLTEFRRRIPNVPTLATQSVASRESGNPPTTD
jgi:hypothetical protein